MAALVAASIAACGGDDEPSNDELRKPPLTVPQDDSPSDTTGTEPGDETDTTETAPDEGGDETETAPDEPLDQPDPGTGAVPAPDSNDQSAAEPPRDSPENDTPPEPGSPEERFEQFCDENPGAC